MICERCGRPSDDLAGFQCLTPFFATPILKYERSYLGPGRLAQLVRARALQARGRRFEPCTAHHVFRRAQRWARSIWYLDCVGGCFFKLTFRAVALFRSRAGDVVQLVRTLPCHGRGREFESRRPRHFLPSTCEWTCGSRYKACLNALFTCSFYVLLRLVDGQ